MSDPQLFIVNTSSCDRATLDGWLIAASLLVSEPNVELVLALSTNVSSNAWVTIGPKTQSVLHRLGIDLERIQCRYVYGLRKESNDTLRTHGFSDQLIRVSGIGIDQLLNSQPMCEFKSLSASLAELDIQPRPNFDTNSIWSSIAPVMLAPISGLIELLYQSVSICRLPTLSDEHALIDAVSRRNDFYDAANDVRYNADQDYVIEVASTSATRFKVDTNIELHELTPRDVSSMTSILAPTCEKLHVNAIRCKITSDELEVSIDGTALASTNIYHNVKIQATDDVWTQDGIIRLGRATRHQPVFNYLETDALIDELSLWRSFSCRRQHASVSAPSYRREAKRLRTYYHDFMKLHFIELLGEGELFQRLRFYQATGELPFLENNPLTKDRWHLMLCDLYGGARSSVGAERLSTQAVDRALAGIYQQIKRALYSASLS